MKIRFLFFLICLCLSSCANENLYNVPDNVTSQDMFSDVQNFTIDEKETVFTRSVVQRKIVYDELIDGITTWKDFIDVHGFNISCLNNLNGVKGEYQMIYDDFINTTPFIINTADIGYNIGYRWYGTNENHLWGYEPLYVLSKSEFPEYYNKVESEMEKFYGTLREGMSEAEICYMLAVSLCENVTYNKATRFTGSAIGGLVDSAIKCEGYSRTYRKLLEGIGIRCDLVRGYTGDDGHMWNRIYFDENWYNVDMTWDDYTSTKQMTESCTSHMDGVYFLQSDHGFYEIKRHCRPYIKEKHHNINASSSLYDSTDFIFRNRDKKTQPYFHNGYWYYYSFDDKTIYRSKFDGSEKAIVYIKDENTDKNNAKMYFGKEQIYFLDKISGAWYKCAVKYTDSNINGGNVNKISIVNNMDNYTTDDVDNIEKGLIALRAEIMLSKMKNAYFHGTEKYAEPVCSERVEFVKVIEEAEDILKTKDAEKAKNIFEKLHNIRKKYTLSLSL